MTDKSYNISNLSNFEAIKLIRNNNIEILATSSIPSEGIHNDVIVNL